MSTVETSIFQKLITELAGADVSDVHLKAGSQPAVRRDGTLELLAQEQVITTDFLQAVMELVFTAEQRQRLEHERQLTVGYTFANRLRLRVTAYYQQGLPELVVRFIPNVIKLPSELGLPPQLEQLIKSESGLILITGPYNSGRSATVNSLLQTLNRTSTKHIITLEEPVEYIITPEQSIIDQREIGIDVPTWEHAVESLPSEDVDVVMFGKILSARIMSGALMLAAGGKLVVGVLEADSTVKAISKVVTSFIPDEQSAIRTQLADTLLAVCMQRLVPRIGGSRVLVCEVLLGTMAVKSAIREGRDYQLSTFLTSSREEGMLSFDRSLAELVKTGEVMHEVALEHAIDKELFQSLARRV